MDQIFKMIEGIAGQQFGKFAQSRRENKNDKWKYCVALSKFGWEAYDFEDVPGDRNDDVIIVFRKENQNDVKIRLNFTEQRMWIKYMQSQKEKGDEANK